jgi:hypothetical protein
MTHEKIETVIIGGGQAGLATSYWLKQHGCEHIVLEKASQPGHAWRQRWDSFTLVTPNWAFRLPGAEYRGDAAGGFMPRDDIVTRFGLVKLPVTDADGFPAQQRGVTAHPGLYFVGMPWLHTQKSGLLLGVGEDAAFIAEHIAARRPNGR